MMATVVVISEDPELDFDFDRPFQTSALSRAHNLMHGTLIEELVSLT
jgi:hypothetical protein